MNFKYYFKRFFWVFPFISFLFGYLFISAIFPKKEFIAPNIIGKSIQESLCILSNKLLNLNILKELIVIDLPEGTILSQFPEAGSKVKENQKIFVTISKWPKPLKVPDFLGLDSKKITEESSKLNLYPRFYLFETFYPLNKCIAQTPNPNQILDNKKIILYISKGLNSFYIVPNLKNCNLESLSEYIDPEKIKLDVYANNKRVVNRDKAKSIIIEQKPIAGSIVDLSKRLYLQVQVE